MPNLFEPDPPPIVGYARVALERGIDISPEGLTYAIPESLHTLKVGDRILAPLGKQDRPVYGIITQTTHEHPLPPSWTDPQTPGKKHPHTIKVIASRDPGDLSLTEDLVQLARWMAGYYCCPLGMVFATMVPASVKRGTGMTNQTLVALPETSNASNLTPKDDTRGTTGGLPASAQMLDLTTSQPIPNKTQQIDDVPDPSSPTPTVTVTKLQQSILDRVRTHTENNQPWTEIRQLADSAGAKTTAPVKSLIDKGLLVTRQQQTVLSRYHRAQAHTDPGTPDSPDSPHTAPHPMGGPTAPLRLTQPQQIAVDQINQHVGQGFTVFLLHGVTGSGKTEVYMRVIEHLLNAPQPPASPPPNPHATTHDSDQDVTTAPPPPGAGIGAGAIVLVPEIAMTPQAVARFTQRFDNVAVLHSGLSGSARHEQWRRIRDGQVRVVVGARSAVFAPLPRVGVIVVDEEHDTSYKQDQLPRYHGRDVAIKRAQNLGIPVVIGSATPSLESYYNATVKRSYHLIRLPDRVTGLTLPRVRIIDKTPERKRRRGTHSLSEPLEQALRETFAKKGQALLLLNRRGWAHYIACPDHGCGWLMNCQHCDAMMVYHKDRQLPTGGLLRCHHCRAEQLLPRHCPLCQKKVTVFGEGTQRLEDEVREKFPDVRMLRIDSDTMRTGRDYDQGLRSFGAGELDLLIGTQIIAKGLDFPNVRVVGVISADMSLHIPDFRGAERTFQLIAQVAGRAGRGQHPGTVFVQTFQPDDPTIELACRHDYDEFAKRELVIRQQAGLPPFTRMARIVVRDQDPRKVDDDAQRLADQLTKYNQRLPQPMDIHGPIPPPITRIAGYHRRQIEIVAPGPHAAGGIQSLLTELREDRLLVSDSHTAVDMDPVALL